jgi:hypothetical protein
MGGKRKSAVAIALTGLFLASAPLTSAWAEDVPNTIALRKVAESRYNLSINLLDEYAEQEVGIRIRRVTGTVSEIITLPSKILGPEGRGATVVNQKLNADDVFLFTVNNIVIYKVALRETTVIDLTNPQGPTPIIFESATPLITESATTVFDYPNDAALRMVAKNRYIFTLNLIDRYAGQEVSINRVRTVKGKSQSYLLTKRTLGDFGKTTVVFNESFAAGDLITVKRGEIVLYTYSVKVNAT